MGDLSEADTIDHFAELSVSETPPTKRRRHKVIKSVTIGGRKLRG